MDAAVMCIALAGVSDDGVCTPHPATLRIKSFDSLNAHNTRSSNLLQPQYRSLVSQSSSSCCSDSTVPCGALRTCALFRTCRRATGARW